MPRTLLTLPLLLTLAACTPALQTGPVVQSGQTFTASCSQVMGRLDLATLLTRPTSERAADQWTPLQRGPSSPSGTTYTSTNGPDTTYFGDYPLNKRVTLTASCSMRGDQATLRLSSQGQDPRLLQSLMDRLLRAIALP